MNAPFPLPRPRPVPLLQHAGRPAQVCAAGFSLIELLVTLIIILVLLAFIIPSFGAWQTTSSKGQMVSETLIALQTSQTLRDGNRKTDAESGSPRLPGVSYAGTAVFFDPASGGLLRFANNNQYAPKSPSGFIATDLFTDSNGKVWNKIPYAFFTSPDPVRLRPGVGIVGIVRNDNGTPDNPADDTVGLQTMPFAVCCGPDNYGLPPAPFVYCDLAGTGTPQQIPTAAPAVVVYLRADLVKAGVDPDDLSTLPGTTGQAKLNALLTRCRGQLVELAPQNGTAVDF